MRKKQSRCFCCFESFREENLLVFLSVSMFIFALFFQWLFDEHGTPVSHFSVGAGFSKSTQTSTARWYDHQYGSSRWLLAEAWFSGVWAPVLSVHGRQDQIVGWCWLHTPYWLCCMLRNKHPVTLHHPIMSMQVQLAMKSSIFHFIVLPYQWSNEEVRFFWALIYDLVERCLRWLGYPACVAGGVGLHMRKGVKHIFVYSLNMQRSRMQSMVCWTDSAGGKVAELKMFGFSYSPPLHLYHLYPAEVDFKTLRSHLLAR